MTSYWQRVVDDGLRVPDERPLVDLTAELTAMLGSPDPALREGVAYAALSAWLAQGVYDDLLAGFGDGISVGLGAGVGESGTDTVFRRALSARLLAGCLRRDQQVTRMPAATVLTWGDRLAAWWVREQDLRDVVAGHGSAAALRSGAEALSALAGSAHLGVPELTVLLDLVADRLLLPADLALGRRTVDAMASATLSVLRRDLVPVAVLEPWVARIARAALVGTGSDPPAVVDNAEGYLRALHLQVALAPDPPAVRVDLLLALVAALRETNPALARPPEA